MLSTWDEVKDSPFWVAKQALDTKGRGGALLEVIANLDGPPIIRWFGA